MDGDCSYEDFRACLLSLGKINRWLLGYRPTLAWLERAPRRLQPIHIVDVGSGGGDLLRRIAVWAERHNIAVRLTGIDMNPLATRAAIELTPRESSIRWITGNAMEYQPQEPVDIIVSSLMAHHLEDEQIVRLVQWMEATSRMGWFINDLERSEWSYRMFGWVRWHPIVRHDGPVSFRRAFRTEDWRSLLNQARIPEASATIEKWRPGRLCVGRWK
ncbi:methyltransferase domain-containing protein [Silvibacterium acidisoli]|uniref:methyltransferase domain-containing protein n=1 Tax=Acidobacteriaceae bacterium ZG23-2 TaxID=2883246 RepID=UPI00406CB649